MRQAQPPPGYGHPPPPQSRGRGRGRGRMLGIVVGALLVGAVIGGAIVLTADDGEDTEGGGPVTADNKKYKLTTPATLLDDYRGSGDGRTVTHPLDGEDRRFLNMAEGTGVSHVYSTLDLTAGEPDASEIEQAKYLTFIGAYGDVSDPEKSVDTFFSVMENDPDEGKEMLGNPERVTPAGFDGGVMKCQMMKDDGSDSSADVEMPLCVWADSSTIAAVTLTDEVRGTSMDEAARSTAAVRQEVRVPVG
ncbi:hypothetical protein LHJ74_11185 [Streptomyces sp. N2-109]|uniref:Uncharacterized protein n=1 Tax=Streptomyces gossypii TaxID=2883101 RepID=A0ABT2JRH2_9ACTN|nr:hypothetical protein [Streptomyces gossypii]MCT2590467.1 hypothetical protein [Streptomyces gossypii]